MSTLCPSGGGLRLPPFPRGRSARRWGPLLLGLPAPARRFKKAATVRSSWPWPLSAAPALGGSRRLTLPPPSCSVRDRPGGGLDAAGLLGTQSAALRASHPGSTAACCPACTTLLALPPPPESRTLPCPCLHVDTNPGLFGVHGRWARLGQDPVKFTVCLDDGAQTQHAVECFDLRSRVSITEKKKKKPVQNNHQRHKAFTWT